jgi:hypothetical protein
LVNQCVFVHGFCGVIVKFNHQQIHLMVTLLGQLFGDLPMKKLIPLVAVTAVALFSSMAIAGGPNCDSMKGHGNKDMSAESWQEFKDNHAWIFSEDSKDMEKSAVPSDDSMKAAPAKTSSDLVEI